MQPNPNPYGNGAYPGQYPGYPGATPGYPAPGQYPGYPGSAQYPGQYAQPGQYPGQVQQPAQYPGNMYPAQAYPGQPNPYPAYPGYPSGAEVQPPPYPGIAGARSFYYIKSQMSGFVAGVQGNRRTPTSIVASRQQASNNDNQLWYDDPVTGTVRSKFNDFCLDIEGANLVLKPCQPGSSTQLWERCRAMLRRTTSQNVVIEIYGASRNESARITVGQNHGGENQQFDFITAQIAPVPGCALAEAPAIPVKRSMNGTGAPSVSSLSAAMGGLKIQRKTFYIVSEMTCKVLDIKGGNPVSGTSVIMWPKHAKPQSNQLWYFDDQGIIRSQLNDFVLDAPVGGAKIRVMPYTGDVRQQWTLQGNRIVNRAHEDLDIIGESKNDGAELCPYQYKGSANQHWRIEYSDGRKAGGDTHRAAAAPDRALFHIFSEMNAKVLDINGANPVTGTSVIMYAKHKSNQSNQLWYFDEQGVIRSALNDFVMDAPVGGAKIKMMPYNGNPRQQWSLLGNRIVNKAHECLDIVGESKKDGAELCSYQYKGSANQHWRIQYVK